MYLSTERAPSANLTSVRENEIAPESLNKEGSVTTTYDLVEAKSPVRLHQMFKGNASFIGYNGAKRLWLMRLYSTYYNSCKCFKELDTFKHGFKNLLL